MKVNKKGEYVNNVANIEAMIAYFEENLGRLESQQRFVSDLIYAYIRKKRLSPAQFEWLSYYYDMLNGRYPPIGSVSAKADTGDDNIFAAFFAEN